jgi:hypothetical protein
MYMQLYDPSTGPSPGAPEPIPAPRAIGRVTPSRFGRARAIGYALSREPMAEPTEQTELGEALQQLETALVRPVVPGELAGWTRAAAEGCARVVATLRCAIDGDHGSRYDEIKDRDPGLLHRVERMQEDDRALLEAAQALEAEASRLAADAARVEPDESGIEDARAAMAQRGTDFVTRVRAHQAALHTWYSEAFYRDRGTVG